METFKLFIETVLAFAQREGLYLSAWNGETFIVSKIRIKRRSDTAALALTLTQHKRLHIRLHDDKADILPVGWISAKVAGQTFHHDYCDLRGRDYGKRWQQDFITAVRKSLTTNEVA